MWLHRGPVGTLCGPENRESTPPLPVGTVLATNFRLPIPIFLLMTATYCR